MKGTSYSRRKVGLGGFPAAVLSIAEMNNEAKMGAISINLLLLLFLCPVFVIALLWCIPGTHKFFSLSKARPSSFWAMKVFMSVSSKSML